VATIIASCQTYLSFVAHLLLELLLTWVLIRVFVYRSWEWPSLSPPTKLISVLLRVDLSSSLTGFCSGYSWTPPGSGHHYCLLPNLSQFCCAYLILELLLTWVLFRVFLYPSWEWPPLSPPNDLITVLLRVYLSSSLPGFCSAYSWTPPGSGHHYRLPTTLSHFCCAYTRAPPYLGFVPRIRGPLLEVATIIASY
jgi:hypothetical protein